MPERVPSIGEVVDSHQWDHALCRVCGVHVSKVLQEVASGTTARWCTDVTFDSAGGFSRVSASQAVPIPWTTGYEEPMPVRPAGLVDQPRYQDAQLPPVQPPPPPHVESNGLVLFTVMVRTSDEQRTRGYIERLLRAGLHDSKVVVDVDHTVLDKPSSSPVNRIASVRFDGSGFGI